MGIGGITALTNGNYVVDSSLWNNGTGAVTFGNGMTGVMGTISSANSLVGSAANDDVGGTDQLGLSLGETFTIDVT